MEVLPVTRVYEEHRVAKDDPVATEFPLTIHLNGEELVTLLCTPTNMDSLAAGFLLSEGLIADRAGIRRLVVDRVKGVVWVETVGKGGVAKGLAFRRLIPSGCGRGALFYHPLDAASLDKVSSQLTVPTPGILARAAEFQRRSQLYRATGGVHSAALCDANELLIFSEDIARHNAIDKLFGECLLKDVPVTDKFILTSGRISSEIVLKAARRGVAIVVSKSAPTALAVRLGAHLDIAIVGFARGRRLNIYSGEWRVRQ